MTGAAIATATRGGRSRSLTAVVLTCFGIVVAAVGLALQIGLTIGSGTPAVPWSLIQIGSFSVVATVLGGILAGHADARSVADVLLVSGFAGAAGLLIRALSHVALLRDSSAAAPLFLASEVLWPFFVAVPVVFLPLVFPSGLLPGWLWRVTAGLAGAAVIGLVLATSTAPFQVPAWATPVDNPFANPEVSLVLRSIALALAGICTLAGFASLVVRFIAGSRLVRHQLALLGLAVALLLAALTFGPLLPEDAFQVSVTIGPLLILGSIAVAVLCYGLYDLNVAVNRVALYSALTVSLTALFCVVYFAAMAMATQLPFAPSGWAAGAVGVAVAVVCAEPLRRRLQRVLELRVLGERSRPLVALARLRESTLEQNDGAISDAIAATIADAVRSPGVAVILFGVDGAGPTPPESHPERSPFVVPLLCRQERIGELLVQRRSPGEEYPARDRELLFQLADQAATILYAVRRDEELAATRRDAIARAAEERAQLGRDLHDGLGPLLAGAGLTTEALRRGFAPGSQDERDAARLAERLRFAAGEIRRFAHDLQPAALTGGSLSAALREYVRSLDHSEAPTLSLEVDGEGLPDAVVETAYFVVLEAVNNVIRHARATRAHVRVGRDGPILMIEVADDGIGLGSAYLSGIGLTSMRQRVQALGGSFSVADLPTTGTVLTAQIPVLT